MSLRVLRGLRAQILIWTILPLIIFLIGISFTSIAIHQNSMRDMVVERDGQLARVAADRLARTLDSRVDLLRSLRNAADTPTNPNTLLQHSDHLLTAFDAGIAVMSDDGQIIASRPGIGAWPEVSTSLRSLANQAKRTEVAYSPILPHFANGQPGLLIAVHNNPVDLVGGVSLDQLGIPNLMAGLAQSPRGRAILVDGQARVIYPADAGLPGNEIASRALAHEIMQGRGGATLERDPSGVEMVVGYAPVPPTGWGLLVREPWADVVDPLMQYTLLAPLLVLVATVVSLLAIYFGVQRIIRPLQALDRQASRVAWGDFAATQTPVGGIREIEDLRRTLNQMAEQIQRYQSSMHGYIATITEGQEEERRRLARELHDDTVQSLVALGQRVEMAQKALARNPSMTVARLAELKEMVSATIADLRRFIRHLRPLYLEDLGLLPALEMLAQELDRQDATRVSYHVTGEPYRLPPDLELAIFRIAQEALNNVAHHAQARSATLHANYDPAGVTLTIEDDGIGFDPPEQPTDLAEQGHFGLMGMRERALLHGGHLSIRSVPGEGTRVVAFLPTPEPNEGDTAPAFA